MIETTTPAEIAKKPIEERNDRELKVTGVLLQRETNRRLKNIENYIAFFFWITILSIVIGIFIYILGEM